MTTTTARVAMATKNKNESQLHLINDVAHDLIKYDFMKISSHLIEENNKVCASNNPSNENLIMRTQGQRD